VAGGFTIFGVVLKIGYDSLAARRAAKDTGLERFADERRQVYERFYELVQRQLAAEKALYALMEAHHKEGKTEISDDEKTCVPPSALAELITTLDQVRRLARLYSVITAAEAIVQLFVDMTRAIRAALDNPGPNDEITWFLLQRFLEDRISGSCSASVRALLLIAEPGFGFVSTGRIGLLIAVAGVARVACCARCARCLVCGGTRSPAA
jgi:hypothetical protein